MHMHAFLTLATPAESINQGRAGTLISQTTAHKHHLFPPEWTHFSTHHLFMPLEYSARSYTYIEKGFNGIQPLFWQTINAVCSHWHEKRKEPDCHSAVSSLPL